MRPTLAVHAAHIERCCPEQCALRQHSLQGFKESGSATAQHVEPCAWMTGTAASTCRPAWSSACPRASGSATAASWAQPPALWPTWWVPHILRPCSQRLYALHLSLTVHMGHSLNRAHPNPTCGAELQAQLDRWVCRSQVKGRRRECQLHAQSPLGDTLLECYSCGNKNAFALGFVPLKVLLLACTASPRQSSSCGSNSAVCSQSHHSMRGQLHAAMSLET